MIRKKYCGTAAKAGGNGENKPHPKVMGVPCLLENSPVEETILPVEETVAHKTDVLDWSWVAAQECQLEFRGRMPLGPLTAFLVLLQMALVSVLAYAVWPFVGGRLAAVLDVRWSGPDADRLPPIEPDTFARAFLPPIAWQAVTLSAGLTELAGAFLYLLVAVPAALIFFDRLATHAVHWMTANTMVDHAAKTAGREAWAWRLAALLHNGTANVPEGEMDTDPILARALQVTRGYFWGLFWILGAFLIPAVVVAITSPAEATATVGLQLAAGTSFGLLIATLVRNGGDLTVVPRFFRMLIHWLIDGFPGRRSLIVRHHVACGPLVPGPPGVG
jgi:hypothetical protein